MTSKTNLYLGLVESKTRSPVQIEGLGKPCGLPIRHISQWIFMTTGVNLSYMTSILRLYLGCMMLKTRLLGQTKGCVHPL